jgi:hypothetical protein
MKARTTVSRSDYKVWRLGLLFLLFISVFSRTSAANPNPLSAVGSSIKVSDERVLGVAQAAQGKKMWFGYGLHTGKSGCAAALSNVLKQAGLPYKGSAMVILVRRELLSGPLSVTEIAVKNSTDYGVDQAKLKQVAKPGDLIFGYMQPPQKPNLGSAAHCGIFAGDGEVYANDWTDGIWKRDVVDRFFAWYKYVYVVRFASVKTESDRTL